MDPRVAWIQPEQKGPANTLWMHIWETSHGIRTSPNPRLNPTMAPGLIKTNSSSCVSPHPVQVSPNFILPSPFDHCSLTALNGTCTGAGKHGASPKNGSVSPSSSSLDSGTDSPKSDSCDSTSTHHPHPRLFFSFNEQLHNINDYLHLQAHLNQHNHHRHPSQHLSQVPDHHHPARKRGENKASTNGGNYLLSNSNGNLFCSGTPWKTRRYSPGVNG